MNNDDIRETPAKTHRATMHLYFNARFGDHSVFSSSTMHETYPDEYIFLASADIEFVIEKTDAELTQAQIDGLTKTKRKVLADAEMQAAKIDAQIQSLLAITHEPA